MERGEDKLIYYCAIPRKIVVPEGFVSKEIAPCKYIVVEHIGSMDKIYETYSKIYKEILSNTKYIPLQESFLHFERYDYRFHWNRENSIIFNMALAPCNKGNQIPLACVDVPKELLILLDL